MYDSLRLFLTNKNCLQRVLRFVLHRIQRSSKFWAFKKKYRFSSALKPRHWRKCYPKANQCWNCFQSICLWNVSPFTEATKAVWECRLWCVCVPGNTTVVWYKAAFLYNPLSLLCSMLDGCVIILAVRIPVFHSPNPTCTDSGVSWYRNWKAVISCLW